MALTPQSTRRWVTAWRARRRSSSCVAAGVPSCLTSADPDARGLAGRRAYGQHHRERPVRSRCHAPLCGDAAAGDPHHAQLLPRIRPRGASMLVLLDLTACSAARRRPRSPTRPRTVRTSCCASLARPRRSVSRQLYRCTVEQRTRASAVGSAQIMAVQRSRRAKVVQKRG